MTLFPFQNWVQKIRGNAYYCRAYVNLRAFMDFIFQNAHSGTIMKINWQTRPKNCSLGKTHAVGYLAFLAW